MRATGQVKTKRCEDEDLERALCNWARWVVTGGAEMRSAFPLSEKVGEGLGATWERPIPVINGEAIEMDSIIRDPVVMPLRYAEVLVIWYVMQFEPPVAARRCRCCIATLYNRLEHAWGIVRQERAARLRAAANLAAAYHSSVTAAQAARSIC